MGHTTSQLPEPEQFEPEAANPKLPEPFPEELLQQAKGARIEYFETQCFIEHTNLLEACDAVLRAAWIPGDDVIYRGKGTMVLLIGPPRVGKTTLIHILEKELLRLTEALRKKHPGYIPFASVTTDIDTVSKGSFDWMDFNPAVLKELKDPFLQLDKKYARRTRDVKEAMIEGLIQRSTHIVIIDEAHHLANARMARRLWINLDHLKSIENKTGVSHILVGTYAMRPFRKVNAQLALRSTDVHFRRYDASIDVDRIAFKSALWALQRQLPLQEEPQLMEHWEFLYARSLGCVGLLKQHLTLALKWALADEDANTITLDLLQKTAPHKDKVMLALRDIIKGEKDLEEPVGADDELLRELKLIEPKAPEKKNDTVEKKESEEKESNSSSDGQEKVSPEGQRRPNSRPFERKPGRDSIGRESVSEEQEEEDNYHDLDDELLEQEDEYDAAADEIAG